MIKKFKSIRNLAVFRNFIWDSAVKAKNGVVLDFKEINVIYGNNYSGKTSLSRIIRASETGVLSDKYENPDFEVEFKNSEILTPQKLQTINHNIRVFNDDFVRDNLKFIFNPDEDINSFAILGSDNNIIEKEIEILENEIGNNALDCETGLYKELSDREKSLNNEKKFFDGLNNSLSDKLKHKALDRNIGIKYKPEKYGDQNYSTTKLENEIKLTLDKNFKQIRPDKIKELEDLLLENPNDPVPAIYNLKLSFTKISDKAKSLVEKKIIESNKIQELVNDAVLNRWVNEGRKHHKNVRNQCAFCGNKIDQSRWDELDKHFDLESEQLENDIDSLINEIESEKKKIEKGFTPDKTKFYNEFHSRIEQLIADYHSYSIKYSSNLDNVLNQLKSRKSAIIKPFNYQPQEIYEENIISIFTEYEKIKNEADKYTDLLSEKQKEAKNKLRLNEVYNFSVTINYPEEIKKIHDSKVKIDVLDSEYKSLLNIIKQKELLIESKKRQLNDEEEGARQVNKFLNDYFGHKFLSLEAVEIVNSNTDTDKKSIKFEIKRDGKKAHHLSEGECSLISFCYFIAKLNDVYTDGKKPIIWIDDPISSLDGNHIFFIYSLIKSEIVEKNSFQQLFISTHNLNFLKYLKRLNGSFINTKGKNQDYEKAFFLINREDRTSQILDMPKYLKEYVTEFNYLFSQIYKCSTIEVINDKNYVLFYNFGNNARKFLEIYLYYKYPDETKDFEKYKKFFGSQPVPAILTERINNEYSHLTANFERGSTPIDAPEMKSTARLIIKRISELDQEQYDSLLKSIN